MGTVEVSPERDLEAGAEVIRASERARVTRLSVAGRMVIRKQPVGPDAQRRLRHEAAMLERLRGVDGVAQVLDAPRYPGSVVLADAGGTRLADVAKPLALDELIRLALALARAAAGMHRRGVMHRDITPANIVISSGGAPCLIDFTLATSFAEIRPAFTHHSQIVGTLAYLAPEQTGRTGRSVDQRADLYAMGATLYELATGRPPFGSGDPLRLTHDHLARVPAAPAEVNRAIPAPLSEIVMHLLEKEPDSRYQTAEGLIYDLEHLREAGASAAVSLRVGAHDVPLRLLPPSRLVGRDDEIAALEAAFEQARTGRCRGVLIGGVTGVGKTALVDELRAAATRSDGWFVAGKFDPYRRDLEFDAVHQAFRALGRLLLAEPEQELAKLRGRILEAVGTNAGLLTATVPELAALLALPPDAGDPLTAQVRSQRAGMDLLRAVASRQRPVVLFVDDLQWAGRTPLGFVDLAFSDEPVDGLLLVGAYREDDVDAAHPLATPLSRWREQAAVRHLRLVNLPEPSLVAMVAEMLHADPPSVKGLVELIEPQTFGNPYETVEMLNALRRDGVLTTSPAGWRWDKAAVVDHLGQSGVPTAGLDAIPPASRQLMEAMACLGGRAELSLLQAATGEPARVVERRLAPALEEGLLVVEAGLHEAVRFRHDRVRERIMRELEPQRRRALQLAMARRLVAVPDLFAVAAEQYLPVVDAVGDAPERRLVVGLLRRAADHAALIGDYTLVNALLTAALQLVDPGDTATLIAVHTGRHAALFSMGRPEETDAEYRTIDGLAAGAIERADATAVQIISLTHRKRFAEAIGLGLDSLRELGIAVPPADRLPTEVDRQLDFLYRWLDQGDAADDPAVPEITDPTLLAASRLIKVVPPAAYFVDFSTYAWLSLEALRIWLEHGPVRALLGPASHAGAAVVALRGDYGVAYRATRRILALGEARGYEPDTSQARFLFSVFSWWFDPIEDGVHAAQRARRGLIAGGDLTHAGHTYHATVQALVDCAPTLDSLLAEVNAGLAFLRRTGNEQIRETLDSYRWLAGVLRDERAAAAGEAVPIDRYSDNPPSLLIAHLTRAIVAAIFGELADLAEHTAAAIPLLPAVPGNYATAQADPLRALALAGQVRAGHGDDRDGLLSELDDVARRLAVRAGDAPANFLHLLRLVEAERAWAVGDFRAAVLAFDAARRGVPERRRPWHRALITERTARFFLAHGVEEAGYDLLADARHQYLAWGATAKVDQLDWAYPSVRTAAGPLGGDRSAVTTGTIDLLGIVSGSQALSSETSVQRLHARAVEVLGAMTGATAVHLLLWSDDRRDWLLPAPADTGEMIAVSGTSHERAVPMSVLRYAERTREPLVVADATRDDRFARDPYFADLGCCSVLAVPILSRGTLQAVLLLENRLIHGAFTSKRLDGVKLVAGQLAVSLDNAQLYAELTTSRARIVAAADQARRRIERDLHDGAQQRFVHTIVTLKLARRALAGVEGEGPDLVDEALENAERAYDELRELAHGIHPSSLTAGGLGPALEALARRSAIPVTVELRTDARLPEHIEATAYFVVSEALTNAVKHSNASSMQITVETGGGDVRLLISDDGVGGADPARGSGLVGLKDRVNAIGGTLTLDSSLGQGTRLNVEVPLHAGQPPSSSVDRADPSDARLP